MIGGWKADLITRLSVITRQSGSASAPLLNTFLGLLRLWIDHKLLRQKKETSSLTSPSPCQLLVIMPLHRYCIV
jgi:hypothetical protein